MKSGVQPWIGCGSKAGWLAAGSPVGVPLLGLARADELGVGRLGEHDLHVGPGLPDDPPDARDGAAGAVAGDEIVELLALEVADDLGRRRALVDRGVGVGLELMGEEPAVGLGELLGLLDHAEALLRLRREHDLGPEHAHELAPLDREGLDHGDDQRIALGGADHGEADAGVAARRLDHGLAGLELTLALGLLDDVEGEPVLDRGRRIEELALHEHPHVRRREPVDLHDRRVADRVEDAPEELAAPRRPAQYAPVSAFDRHRNLPWPRTGVRAQPLTDRRRASSGPKGCRQAPVG